MLTHFNLFHKRVATYAFVVFIMLFESGIANEETGKNKKSQLVIASSNNFPPINLLDENKELTGFARDIADAVARAKNIDVKHIHSSSWSNVLKWLDDGTADLIHDTGYTKERTDFLDFTQPIIEMPEVIFVKESRFNIKSFASLQGKKVACVNKHITHIYLQRYKDIQCHIVNTPTEGLISLLDGSVDAFIYPKQIVLYLAQNLELADRIKIIGEPLRTLSWSMTVKKGNTRVLDILNQGISSIKKSGEYQKIYNKWFGNRVLSGYTKKEVLFISSVSVIIVLLIAAIVALYFYSKGMRKINLALSDSENKYRTLADKLPESVFHKDTKSVYISCNKNYADILGIKPEDIVGKNDFDFHPEKAKEYQQGDRKVMALGKVTEFIEKIKIDGEWRYIQTIKTPVYNEAHILTGVLGIFWDITEQRGLQNKLKETIKEYNAITATVPDVMYRLDINGNFKWWNKTFERITGLTTEQISNLFAADVIADDDRGVTLAAIIKAIEYGYAEVEAKLITPQGNIHYIFNGAALYDDEGQVIGLAGSGRDITEQRAQEEKALKLQHQLQQAQKIESIGQLTGGIAHDFNNLLGSVLGYSELALVVLESGDSNEEINDKIKMFLEQINLAGQRGRDLVENMMAYSRSHKGEIYRTEIKIFIDELFKLLRPMLPTSIDIQVNVNKELPEILIDPVMVQQMLINLCLNARDAMAGSGKLEISVSLEEISTHVCDSCHHSFDGEYISLSISDTGEGIPPDIFGHIFEPFVTSKEVGKGTGMGLAMVHGITHEHNGHINVTSKPGNTCFTIYIPLTNDINKRINALNPVSQENISYDKEHHKILVVDDEPAITALLNELLSSYGYKTIIAHNGQEALDVFSKSSSSIDLIITDQTMPVMTGKELAIKVLKSQPDMPIILCTGYTDKINEREAIQLGIYSFLTKPVDYNQLLSLIQKILVSE